MPVTRRPLLEVAALFVRLGATAFGGPAAHVAMMEDEVVRRRGWLSREAFLDYLGATNLIPGPNSTELAIHVVNFIGQRSGLLVDIDDGQRFRFTHRTFQEYLAARWIATGSYGARLQKIQEKIDDVNWREAIFLSLGCLVSTVKDAYDDALLIISRLLQEDPPPAGDSPLWERHHLVCETFVRQF